MQRASAGRARDGDRVPAGGRSCTGADAVTTPGSGTGGAVGGPTPSHDIDWQRVGPELRTPLHAILGNVELLLDGTAGPLSAEARKCLGEVQSAGRQLSRHVQSLLLWLELCTRDGRREDACLDLVALLCEMRATARAAPLAVEAPNACLLVRGDRFWLRTLMTEILALCGAGAAPAITLESRPDGKALDFVWRHRSSGEAGPLQVALIQAIAQAQGAVAALTSNGLCLYWPAASLAGAGAIDAGPGRGPGAERSDTRVDDPAAGEN